MKSTVEKQKNVIRFVLPARSGKLLQIFQQPYIVTKKATVFAPGQENGDIRLTAQRSTNRRAVKVLVTVDARGRVKGIRTGSAVITVKAGRAVYRTVIKVTK